ncbi:MAG: four helix bundle protein [Chthonomonas sp.]|nr:four helix bundle protein [Chthonomonas sp.]
MQSAAVSISSNIAEGYEWGGKDFCRFLRIARGSNAELRSQLTIAAEVGLISKTDADSLKDELMQIAKMITKLDHSRRKAMEQM